MRHGMVNRHIIANGLEPGSRVQMLRSQLIGQGWCGPPCSPRAKGQHDCTVSFTNSGANPFEQIRLIENLNVMCNAWVKARRKDLGSRLASICRSRWEVALLNLAAAIAASQIEVVRFVPGLLRQQPRSGHVEYNIIWMRRYGDGRR